MSEVDALLAQCTLLTEFMQCTDVNCTCESNRLGIDVFCRVLSMVRVLIRKLYVPNTRRLRFLY